MKMTGPVLTSVLVADSSGFNSLFANSATVVFADTHDSVYYLDAILIIS